MKKRRESDAGFDLALASARFCEFLVAPIGGYAEVYQRPAAVRSSSWAVRPLAASAPAVLGRVGAVAPVRSAGAAIWHFENASSSFALCGEEKPIQNAARGSSRALAGRLLTSVWSNPSIKRTCLRQAAYVKR
jgi:hypothetical protein